MHQTSFGPLPRPERIGERIRRETDVKGCARGPIHKQRGTLNTKLSRRFAVGPAHAVLPCTEVFGQHRNLSVETPQANHYTGNGAPDVFNRKRAFSHKRVDVAGDGSTESSRAAGCAFYSCDIRTTNRTLRAILARPSLLPPGQPLRGAPRGAALTGAAGPRNAKGVSAPESMSSHVSPKNMCRNIVPATLTGAISTGI